MINYKNSSLYLEGKKYIIYNHTTGNSIYLPKKLNQLIYKLKRQSWKYSRLSGKCDEKIEKICIDFIKRNK